MKSQLLFILILFPLVNFGQSKVKTGKGFTVSIPEWLDVKIDDDVTWGGTMPVVEGIENAISFSTFDKSSFGSFENFQHIFITGNKFGEPCLFEKEQIWYGRNERDFMKIKNGVSSKVFVFWQNHIYHNQFVLIETSQSFLFINFCSTPETYDANLPKFNELLQGLKIE